MLPPLVLFAAVASGADAIHDRCADNDIAACQQVLDRWSALLVASTGPSGALDPRYEGGFVALAEHTCARTAEPRTCGVAPSKRKPEKAAGAALAMWGWPVANPDGGWMALDGGDLGKGTWIPGTSRAAASPRGMIFQVGNEAFELRRDGDLSPAPSLPHRPQRVTLADGRSVHIDGSQVRLERAGRTERTWTVHDEQLTSIVLHPDQGSVAVHAEPWSWVFPLGDALPQKVSAPDWVRQAKPSFPRPTGKELDATLLDASGRPVAGAVFFGTVTDANGRFHAASSDDRWVWLDGDARYAERIERGRWTLREKGAEESVPVWSRALCNNWHENRRSYLRADAQLGRRVAPGLVRYKSSYVPDPAELATDTEHDYAGECQDPFLGARRVAVREGQNWRELTVTEGLVTDSSGEPLVGFPVRIDGPVVHHRAVTDVRGRFRWWDPQNTTVTHDDREPLELSVTGETAVVEGPAAPPVPAEAPPPGVYRPPPTDAEYRTHPVLRLDAAQQPWPEASWGVLLDAAGASIGQWHAGPSGDVLFWSLSPPGRWLSPATGPGELTDDVAVMGTSDGAFSWMSGVRLPRRDLVVVAIRGWDAAPKFVVLTYVERTPCARGKPQCAVVEVQKPSGERETLIVRPRRFEVVGP